MKHLIITVHNITLHRDHSNGSKLHTLSVLVVIIISHKTRDSAAAQEWNIFKHFASHFWRFCWNWKYVSHFDIPFIPHTLDGKNSLLPKKNVSLNVVGIEWKRWEAQLYYYPQSALIQRAKRERTKIKDWGRRRQKYNPSWLIVIQSACYSSYQAVMCVEWLRGCFDVLINGHTANDCNFLKTLHDKQYL